MSYMCTNRREGSEYSEGVFVPSSSPERLGGVCHSDAIRSFTSSSAAEVCDVHGPSQGVSPLSARLCAAGDDRTDESFQAEEAGEGSGRSESPTAPWDERA